MTYSPETRPTTGFICAFDQRESLNVNNSLLRLNDLFLLQQSDTRMCAQNARTLGRDPNSLTRWPFSQMKHSTDQRAHQPTLSSSLLKSQQLYLTCNIDNLIYFPAPLYSPFPSFSHLTYPHTQAQKAVLALMLLSKSAGKMRTMQHSIKNNFLHHWSHNTCSSWFLCMKRFLLVCLLLSNELNVKSCLCYTKTLGKRFAMTPTEMKGFARTAT